MRDSGIRDYYERELRYLRELGREFGKQHPEIADALRLEDNRSDDPHVERLLEGFAFLAARVHRRIDDDFSEICQSLLNVVYPHYLRPIPAVSIVQFHPDRSLPAEGGVIPAGSTLVAPPAENVRCRFRTSYDVTLWPVSVAEAAWQPSQAFELGSLARDVGACLRLRLRCGDGVTWGELPLQSLRFYIHGDFPLAAALYQALDNDCIGILVRDPRTGQTLHRLPSGAIHPVGFEDREQLFQQPDRSFAGYGTLAEYFVFPSKYLFVEVRDLDGLRGRPIADEVELLFLMRTLESAERQDALTEFVTKDTLRLGCTPVVNLFSADSEPIRLDHRQTEYLVRTHSPKEHPYEIHSVDEVWAVTPTNDRVAFEPFYSYRHRGRLETKPLFWHARRFPSKWLEKSSTDVGLAFVDLEGQTIQPPYPSVMARLTVFNGLLPSKLDINHLNRGKGGLELKGGGAALERIQLVNGFTKPIQPPLDGVWLWRLVAHLSLNYLSLTDANGDALRELLRLYNFGQSDLAEKQIRGVAKVDSEPCHAQVWTDQRYSFVRGRRVNLEFAEEKFSGGGMYLLASVLERFLGMYVTLNSFTSLVARVRAPQKTYLLREWEPRSGTRRLI